ncbi:DUF4139 domain-containing protein [Pseudooceanicola sp. LIPI14-2-Ac024]|uniref:DUF4139 domain-containing protein n=1 Tax=Pseudooceanicola sp. LIPI14-2-Ac024 TaxID=3344875 RepID=UPI0035CF6789
MPLLFPLPALADDIPVPSRVASVTVFPQGASLVREGQFSAPAGRHTLILTDMPVRDARGLRIEADGVSLGPVTIRNDLTPPRDPQTDAAIEAAEAEVERLEKAVAEARDAAGAIRLEAEAARAQIEFLKGLGASDGIAAAGIDTLRDLSRMVGEETLAAERRAQQAEIRAREADLAMKDRLEELDRARKALAALDIEDADREYVAITVDAPEAVEGTLKVRYVTDNAGWRPVYDVHLDRGADGGMSIGRGAYVHQATGENWQDVDLELSTVRPTGQNEPGTLYPIQRWIVDENEPPAPIPLNKRFLGAAESDMAMAPMAEQIVAQASYDGLNVTYSYETPLTLATGADELRIALGSIDVAPEVMARAVPIRDETAFLMAEFTNPADEILLPTEASEFYLDGTYVGQRPTPLIAAGDEAEFSFGPIEGLRLKRTVQDRSEGDRGVISRSNRLAEAVEIEIRNLTGEAWDLRLIDQVPYSEQEDLKIEWNATPEPTEVDVDGERGILAWDLALEPNSTSTVQLNHTLSWPTDKVLR